MDTIAFIVALGVGVVLMVWYALNEQRGEEGSAGLLAITGEAHDDDEDSEAGDADRRYRIRERLAPAKRAGLRAGENAASYRAKPAAKKIERGEPEDIIEADKEY